MSQNKEFNKSEGVGKLEDITDLRVELQIQDLTSATILGDKNIQSIVKVKIFGGNLQTCRWWQGQGKSEWNEF